MNYCRPRIRIGYARLAIAKLQKCVCLNDSNATKLAKHSVILKCNIVINCCILVLQTYTNRS